VADIEKGSFLLFRKMDGPVSGDPGGRLDRHGAVKAVARREGVYRKNAVFGVIWPGLKV